MAEMKTYFQRYPNGFWMIAASGYIVDSFYIWADGKGKYWLDIEEVIRVMPWELL